MSEEKPLNGASWCWCHMTPACTSVVCCQTESAETARGTATRRPQTPSTCADSAGQTDSPHQHSTCLKYSTWCRQRRHWLQVAVRHRHLRLLRWQSTAGVVVQLARPTVVWSPELLCRRRRRTPSTWRVSCCQVRDPTSYAALVWLDAGVDHWRSDTDWMSGTDCTAHWTVCRPLLLAELDVATRHWAHVLRQLMSSIAAALGPLCTCPATRLLSSQCLPPNSRQHWLSKINYTRVMLTACSTLSVQRI